MVKEQISQDATTTVRSVLQYVVGLSPDIATTTLEKLQVKINGQPHTNGEDEVRLSVGNTVEVGSATKINVIGAHLRTLAFYQV